MKDYLNSYCQELSSELFKLDAVEFEKAINVLIDVYKRDAQVFIAGNGGSAGTSNHFVCDFSKNALPYDKRRFRIISVCDNVEKITAYGNDFCFEDIFSFQLGNLMRPGDALIVISASGNSPDLVKACEYAKSIGGKICNGADAVLKTDQRSYEVIEDLHSAIMHMIVCWFKANRDKLD